MLDAVVTFVEGQAAAPWALLVLLLVAGLDALFPPVPSDPVLIVLAAVSVAGHGWPLWLLGVVAAVGAFAGDTGVHLVGRRFGRAGLARLAARPVLGRAVHLATRTLDERGGLVVVLARYVPAGRVAVGLTAGASGYPRRRFVGFAALAAASWAAYGVGIGALAGRWASDEPILAAVVGVGFALVLGLAVDRVVRRLVLARVPGGGPAGDGVEGAAPLASASAVGR